MKVAVVGAGIMGANTALSLSWRGHQVTLYDPRPLNHKEGSSHGRSRIIRRTYTDPFYTKIMMEGYHLWRRIENRAGLPLYNECGLLYFGKEDSDDLQSALAALVDNQVAHTVVDATTVGSVFPRLALKPGEFGIFTPEAGWISAEKAVRCCVEWAISEGAELRAQEADPHQLAREYDAVVVCAGAWTSRLIPSLKTDVTLQTVGYFAAQLGDAPVYIEDGPDLFYGFPPESWRGPTVKVAMHTGGPTADLDQENRPPLQEHLDQLREFIQDRFNIPNPTLTESYTCLYTRTKDEDFRWGTEDSNIFWVSPCSGHGFKFAPWIGDRMADFVEGKRQMNEWPRFVAPS